MKSNNRTLERIADESTDGNIELIVSKVADDKSLREYLSEMRQNHIAGRTVSFPKTLLPPPYGKLPRKDNSAEIANFNRSVKLSSSITGATLASIYSRENRFPPQTESSNISMLKEIIASKTIRNLVHKNSLKKAGSETIPFLPIAGVALLRLSKDDILQLPSNLVDGNYKFFSNQIIQPPSIHKLQKSEFPPSITDFRTHTWGLEKTGAMAGWGAFNARGQGVKIAVLDTGIDPKHPDLIGRVHSYAEFDKNGQIVTQNIDDAYDDHGHGTHCAGTIAGDNSGGKWIGMAPEAQIIAGKVLGSNGGSVMQILAGMDWAINSGADLISMSLGDLSFYPEVADTYTNQIVYAHQKGIPVVAAIGNDGHQTSGNPGSNILSFSIGATNHLDRVAGFSGGRTQVIKNSSFFAPDDLPLVYMKPDITAPGVEIYSSLPDGKYGVLNGTSMATPHVAGAIAQLLSQPGGLRTKLSGARLVNVVQSLLIGSVNDLGEIGQDQRYGHGRLNVLNALSEAQILKYWAS